MNEITIYTQGQPLAVKEYQGQRVITFRDMDTLHQRPEGTARRNFNANRGRFIEGEDFFKITADEFRRAFLSDEFRPLEISNRGVTLLTKMGYLMLVKSFTDDLAWMVQRQLVKSYFEARPVETPPPALPDGKKPLHRMRTIPKAVAELREEDPNTSVTLYRLRRWVKQGKVKSFDGGQKSTLVDLDDVRKMASSSW